jgi:hypothetical protein
VTVDYILSIHVIMKAYYIVLHLLNKSTFIILLETADSLRYFVLLFLSVLFINTGYEDEYQDYPDS